MIKKLEKLDKNNSELNLNYGFERYEILSNVSAKDIKEIRNPDEK